MLKRHSMSLALVGALALGAVATATTAQNRSQSQFRYQVDIVNLTKGQQFTPMLLTTHSRSLTLFRFGQPASSALETLAEEGNVSPLNAALSASSSVNHIVTGNSLTDPGATASFEINGSPHDRLTIAAMLIPTNDTFVALRGGVLPSPRRSVTYILYAYDAGTERNDELCASVPGPFFVECGGPGGGAAPEGGEEGYVYVSNGIHGVGDLDPALRDWRNPVATVTITSIKK